MGATYDDVRARRHTREGEADQHVRARVEAEPAQLDHRRRHGS